MIFINPDRISIPESWKVSAHSLTEQLKQKTDSEKMSFIDSHRSSTWRHSVILDALRQMAGNKCWYSEVPLDGADVDIDHFRPKGSVREIDDELQDTGSTSSGYWWLSFEYRNFRLSSQHANQRRVDKSTSGGKWNYFPVDGQRTDEGTEWPCIMERNLALDPCSASDVRLLWFDLEGRPCCTRKEGKKPSEWERRRVQATIWLYHLDKDEIQISRGKHVEDILKDINKADTSYKLWGSDLPSPNLQSKLAFDQKVAEIQAKLADDSPFAGAKRSVVRQAMATYTWVEDYISL